MELAPVDPRSLMQGDYMRLNYTIANLTDVKTSSKRGYFVVTLDNHNVAKRKRLQENEKPLDTGELLIKNKTVNTWMLQIGAESYFFEEGKGKKFEKAKYGGLKIDDNGNSILVGLYDESFKLLTP